MPRGSPLANSSPLEGSWPGLLNSLEKGDSLGFSLADVDDFEDPLHSSGEHNRPRDLPIAAAAGSQLQGAPEDDVVTIPPVGEDTDDLPEATPLAPSEVEGGTQRDLSVSTEACSDGVSDGKTDVSGEVVGQELSAEDPDSSACDKSASETGDF